MDRGDIQKLTNTIASLSRMSLRLEDKFLAGKVNEKMSEIVFEFTEFIRSSPADASHNVKHTNLLNVISGTSEYLEYIGHSLGSQIGTPLLLAQKNLLDLKLLIIREGKTSPKKETRQAADFQNANGFQAESRRVGPASPKGLPRNSVRRDSPRKDSNKEKIYDYIRRFPDARTKEIIEEFNILSGRTVKRNLKELIQEGLISKRSDAGAVYYHPVNS